jgi:hypothetical protein
MFYRVLVGLATVSGWEMAMKGGYESEKVWGGFAEKFKQ